MTEQRPRSPRSTQQAQKEAERETIAATIDKLQTLIPVIEQRVDIRKKLMEKEFGSKLTYSRSQQLLPSSATS